LPGLVCGFFPTTIEFILIIGGLFGFPKVKAHIPDVAL